MSTSDKDYVDYMKYRDLKKQYLRAKSSLQHIQSGNVNSNRANITTRTTRQQTGGTTAPYRITQNPQHDPDFDEYQKIKNEYLYKKRTLNGGK